MSDDDRYGWDRSTPQDGWTPQDRQDQPREPVDPSGQYPSFTPPAQAVRPTAFPAQGSAFSAAPAMTGAPAPAPSRRSGPSWPGVVTLVAAVGLLSSGLTLGGVVGYDVLTGPDAVTASNSAPAADGSTAADTSGTDWQSVASTVSASTVAISVTTAQGQAEGTGVILDDKGTIVTNNHVVAGGKDLSVRLTDGRSFTASVVGTDPSTDLAVIRLDSPPSGLQPATLGDSSQVAVGQAVMAVGTPLGLDNTVTTGIISAVHRPVSTQGESTQGESAAGADAAYTSALQTDAAINPGNSGGPLVDASGQVIGINSSIAGLASSESADAQAGSIGLGFAIPSSTVSLIVGQLIEHGSAQHALFGVTASDGSQASGGASYDGALIRSVTGDGPAQQAGLREGDLVVAVDDVPMPSATALTAYVRSLEVGSTHTVHYLRDGSEATATVTLSQAS